MATASCRLIFLVPLVLTVLAKIDLLAQNFKLAEGGGRNVKLIWTSDINAEEFRVYRKSSNSDYQVLATGSFKSYDDYDVPDGPHTYQVHSRGSTPQVSNRVTKNPPAAQSLQGFELYDNTKPSILRIPSRIQLNDIYYKYNTITDQDGFKEIREYTSVDGLTFNDYQVVLTRKEVCASGAAGLCKLESQSFTQNPKTLEVVMWAHWEDKDGYKEGRAAVGFGSPGHGPWTFGGAFHPLGHDSRDLTMFADDDGSGYIISSTRMNQDINIYRLTPNWHHCKTLVATVLKGQAREAPAMLHHGRMYYLFSSKAAGWYPSTGRYISAPTIAGPWSENRVIGNLGGFAAQSGDLIKLGSRWVMHANKWRNPDIDPIGTRSRQLILPISFLNGIATYTFYPQVLYRSAGTDGGAYGVQNGRIVSVGKQVASTGAAQGHDERLATSGVNTNPERYYRPTSTPFIYAIDLGAAYTITQIELTNLLVPGSETAAKFTVEGSLQASGPFTQILDRSSNTQIGFVSATVSPGSHCRFIALKAQKFTNMHTKNPGTAGIPEFTVYGRISPGHTIPSPRPLTVDPAPVNGLSISFNGERLLINHT